jgi:hypothetical protein
MRVTGRRRDRPARPAAAPEAPVKTTGNYAALISRLAPGENPARVEAMMRHTHGSVRSISPTSFAREVKAAVTRIHASDRCAP